MHIPQRVIAIAASIGLGSAILVGTATSALAGAGAPLPKVCDTANVFAGYAGGPEGETYMDDANLGAENPQDASLTWTTHEMGMTISITPWVDRWTRFSWSADPGVKILAIQVARSDWGYPKSWGLVNHSFSTPPGVQLQEVLICAYNPALPTITARG